MEPAPQSGGGLPIPKRLLIAHDYFNTEGKRKTGKEIQSSSKQIAAGDFRIEDRGKCNPRSVRNKRRSGRSVNFAGGIDIRKDRAFQRKRIHKRGGDPMLAEK